MFDKLFDFLISILKFFQFLDVVDAYQAGVVLRFGKFHREVGPGLVWLLPFFIDKLVWDNVVIEPLSIGPQSLTTKDGKSVVISPIVYFRIVEPRVFLLDVEGRNVIVKTTTCSVTSLYVRKHTWAELQELDIENDLAILVRRKAKKFGVGIEEIGLEDFAECPSIRLIQPVPLGR